MLVLIRWPPLDLFGLRLQILDLLSNFERFKHLTFADTNLILDPLLRSLQVFTIANQRAHAHYAIVWIVDLYVIEKTLHRRVWLMNLIFLLLASLVIN